MEKLYNNIVLDDDFNAQPSDPDDVPYLKNPPEVIDVTVGRQLFVDDFLIEETTLAPVFHEAKKYEGNPVLFPEADWETKDASPVAAPLSGGAWYDEKEHLFKMWYHAGWQEHACYAVSEDGIHWERPALDIIPGTNIILDYDRTPGARERDPAHYLCPDTTAFLIDDADPDPSRRYKFHMTNPGWGLPSVIATSPDGIHWDNFTTTVDVGDCSTAFYNPFRRKWVYSIRSGWSARARDYYECDDLYDANRGAKPVQWLKADERDKANPYLGNTPQLYNVNAVGYESIMLGMFDIHYGPENNICCRLGVPKITEVQPMFSRDGYHFSRPRKALIHASMYEGAWDRGYVKAACGVTVIHGDELWFYYSAFGGDERFGGDDEHKSGIYMNGATGLAKLRRDGFVSMDGCGSLLTRPIVFFGKRSLHINAVGEVKVSVLTADGALLAEAAPFSGDSTNAMLDLGGFDLSAQNGKTLRLKFDVKGSLYAFGFADEKGDFGGAHAGGLWG